MSVGARRQRKKYVDSHDEAWRSECPAEELSDMFWDRHHDDGHQETGRVQVLAMPEVRRDLEPGSSAPGCPQPQGLLAPLVSTDIPHLARLAP